MTPLTAFAGRHVALFGLGSSGLVAAQALLAGGAAVTAWDDTEASRAKAAAAGVPLLDLRTADWSRFDSFVVAPGVPLTHPAPHWSVALARAAGVEVIGDIELFCRERARRAPHSRFVAITGTNGKSTTTALTAHLFRAFGHDVGMGGNIGTPILELPPPSADLVHVVECSSFQIDLAPSLDPSVGVLLNLTPDHLDRHGTMENYAAIKERLVAGAARAVVGVDDPDCRAVADRLAARGRPLERLSVAGQAVSDGHHPRGNAPRAPPRRRRDAARRSRRHRLAARRPQRPERRRGRRRARRRGRRRRPAAGGACAAFPASPTAWSRSAASAACCSSTIPRRPTPTRRKRRCCPSRACAGSSAARCKEGGIEPLRPLFRASAKAYLDRRRQRRVRSDAGGRRAVRALRHARRGPGRRHARPRPGQDEWCCSRPPARRTTSSPASTSGGIIPGVVRRWRRRRSARRFRNHGVVLRAK